ncbi:VWA domain-containing protein [Polyangium jinanense]|uniref:VWA domain-containing protein n=1 Tax=Polyangium jinanense TaxID=2829994 RepID=A0A9X3X0K8_9BACT|nr:VWA domain-containing protein [Polyangium jinanense]MDC3952972.1 VWA domain-containing protein [Polyangium jinanense]MDC3980590.1 VWA domain-containing protein [Polyangium jinanense]
MSTYDAETRWRLILGPAGNDGLGDAGAGKGEAADLERALSWLYDRETDGEANRSIARGRPGSGPEHPLDVPDWINTIHELFPKEAIERLESDALHRYHILDVVTRKEALENVTPSLSLVEAILRCKSRMDAHVLDTARAIVDKVVEDLKKRLCDEIEHRLGATPFRHRRSRFRVTRNLDALRTIRKNLQHWDPDKRRLLIERPEFFARVRRFGPRYQVIVLVDQSGSMARNIIHAAVLASVLWKLPSTRSHLVVYDTEVVDLTPYVDDPVELLLRVQLGGGTDGAKALQYAAELVDMPHRTILLWITDFEDQADKLVREVTALVGEGVTVFGAASLDDQVRGAYDHGVAQAVADAGAHVAATTPRELVGWLVERIRR